MEESDEEEELGLQDINEDDYCEERDLLEFQAGFEWQCSDGSDKISWRKQ